MVVLINTGLPDTIAEAIKFGVPDKWKSAYHFLQIAATEKLQREGLINFDNLSFIRYKCPKCEQCIYVLPDVAGRFDWLYHMKCFPFAPPQKTYALIRGDMVQGKDIPAGAEIRRY